MSQRRINLLPAELASGRAKAKPAPRLHAPGAPRRRRPALFVILVAGLLAAGAWSWFRAGAPAISFAGWLRGDVQALRAELRQTQAARDELRTEIEEEQARLAVARAELEEQRLVIEQARKSITEARQPEVPVSAMLADVVRVIPEGVWITKLSYAGPTLKIVGLAQQAELVTTLMDRMERSGKFRDTTFAYTKRAPAAEPAKNQDPRANLFTFEISARPQLFRGTESGS
ncbi:MAG TPA: PilN domain-containing protein [bacterium]